MSERVMWNAAISEMFNRIGFVHLDSSEEKDEIWIELDGKDSDWGYKAVERQLPEGLELMNYYKGRSSRHVNESVYRTRLLTFIRLVVQAGEKGISKTLLANQLGLASEKTISNYVD